jgi:hypothetical protein
MTIPNPDTRSVLIILAFVFALFAAIQPQPFFPRVHPGWLAVALFLASMLVR